MPAMADVDAQIAKATTELAARLDASAATLESRMTSVESELRTATSEIQENISVTVAGVEEKLTAVQGDFSDMSDAFAELGARVEAARVVETPSLPVQTEDPAITALRQELAGLKL